MSNRKYSVTGSLYVKSSTSELNFFQAQTLPLLFYIRIFLFYLISFVSFLNPLVFISSIPYLITNSLRKKAVAV